MTITVRGKVPLAMDTNLDPDKLKSETLESLKRIMIDAGIKHFPKSASKKELLQFIERLNGSSASFERQIKAMQGRSAG